MKKQRSAIRSKFLNYRYNSLLARAFRTIFAGVALPLMVMIVAIYIFSQNILNREMEAANLRALDTAEAIANTLFEDVYAASMRIALDEDVTAILRSSLPESYADFQRVWAVIGTLELNRKDTFVDSIYLYNKRSGYLITNNAFASRMAFARDQDILTHMDFHSARGVYWVRRDMQPQFTTNAVPVLTLFRPVTSPGAEGMVVVNVCESTLIELFGGTSRENDGSMALIDESGVIVFDMRGAMTGLTVGAALGAEADAAMGKGARGVFPVEHPSERLMAAFTRLGINGWTLVKLVPYNTYAGSLLALQAFVLGSLVMGLLISLFVAAVLGARLHHPIEEIVGFIDRTQEGDKTVANDELNYILMHLVSLYDENKLLEQERLDRYAALRASQAHALQAQITPHFLHNTLQAIGWQILKTTGDENNPAIQALVMLSDMARDTMEDTGNLTMLKDELDYVDNYVALQRLRYQDSLKYERRVPDELLCTLVPRICLQPLVENAIEHALSSRDGCGRIEIAGRLDGGDLLLDVLDDGIGMPEEEIAQLNASFVSGGDRFIRHIGLGNVNLRIKLLFGDAYHLTVTLRESGGIAIRIRVPATTQSPENHTL